MNLTEYWEFFSHLTEVLNIDPNDLSEGGLQDEYKNYCDMLEAKHMETMKPYSEFLEITGLGGAEFLGSTERVLLSPQQINQLISKGWLKTEYTYDKDIVEYINKYKDKFKIEVEVICKDKDTYYREGSIVWIEGIRVRHNNELTYELMVDFTNLFSDADDFKLYNYYIELNKATNKEERVPYMSAWWD